MFNRLKEITIMKKYIAPSVEILAINSEAVLALSFTPSVGGSELSNRADAVDTDWDDED